MNENGRTYKLDVEMGKNGSNGYIFPKAVVSQAVDEFNTRIKETPTVGQIGPATDAKSRLQVASHEIVSADIDELGNGEVTIRALDAEQGQLLVAMLESGNAQAQIRATGYVKPLDSGEVYLTDPAKEIRDLKLISIDICSKE